jgi:hypothetical protein
MPIFLASPDLGGGGTALDGVAQPRPVFTLFMIDFFDTSAFHFLMAACEASELAMGQGAYGTPIRSSTRFR